MGIASSGKSRGISWNRVIIALVAISWLVFLAVKIGIVPDLLFLGSYQADLLALLFVFGIFVSVCGIASLLLARWLDSLIHRGRLLEKESQSVSHRNFLRRLDHEMRNPLTTIRLGMLNVEQNPTSDHRETLTRVVQQTQRLQKLTEELRYLGEIEEYQIESSPVNLQEMLTSIVSLVCSTPEHQCRVVDIQIQQVPWPLPDLLGDPDLLFMAFRNLIDNALKYTLPEHKVVVRASEDGHMAVVEVADTGIGIPSDALAYVFEDLFRGQNARSLPGNGLGLALVQRIINLHAGRIEINSRLDQGTVVKVWLPLVSKG